jgi:hypothetical protein
MGKQITETWLLSKLYVELKPGSQRTRSLAIINAK